MGNKSKVIKMVIIVSAAIAVLWSIQMVFTCLGYTTTGIEGFMFGASVAILFLPLVGCLFDLLVDAWNPRSE